MQKSASLTDRDDGEAEIDSSTGTSRLRLESNGAPPGVAVTKAESNGSLDPDHRNRCRCLKVHRPCVMKRMHPPLLKVQQCCSASCWRLLQHEAQSQHLSLSIFAIWCFI